MPPITVHKYEPRTTRGLPSHTPWEQGFMAFRSPTVPNFSPPPSSEREPSSAPISSSGRESSFCKLTASLQCKGGGAICHGELVANAFCKRGWR
ncbi:hypothetical protein AVEN_236819-1 [Araneus ventricosus]|uniref:Uncharacterized protein n=1 Tax=Araneus ventricosus TaxID=182803 RepID=A0A4Y2E1K2_ARAVE|nr:hypothetical protein AVEN_236819-1 [Araneus ventricosus]